MSSTYGSVKIVERRTFLELEEVFECNTAPVVGRLRSHSDSVLLQGSYAHVEARFDQEDLEENSVESWSAKGEETESTNTSIADEADPPDTSSVCSWATDQEDWERRNSRVSSPALTWQPPLWLSNGPYSMQLAYVVPAVPCLMVPSSQAVASPATSCAATPAATSASVPETVSQPTSNRRCQRTRRRAQDAAQVDPTSTDSCELPSTEWTTLILRNIPQGWSRQDVVTMLDSEGFQGSYDFVHVPVKFGDFSNVGYALVNLMSPESARRVMECLSGDGPIIANWNSPGQGLESQIERYRNSAVMHESVPEVYRPGFFVDGVVSVFPEPTMAIRAPRIRASKRFA